MSGANCVECGGQLVFAPDGRSRLCEQCGWQEKVERKRPSAAEIARTLQLTNQYEASETDSQGVKLRLAQGIAAAKAGDKDEAFYCLEWILHTDSSDAQRAEAWLWLSGLYEEDADRRVCLEQALAHQSRYSENGNGRAHRTTSRQCRPFSMPPLRCPHELHA